MGCAEKQKEPQTLQSAGSQENITGYVAATTGSGVNPAGPLMPGGFVAYWKFDENSWVGAANEVREVKSAYHGTAVGGASTVPVVFGRAGLFDGANDSVSAPAIALANSVPAGLPDATISFWVKPDRKSLLPQQSFAGLVELGNPASVRYVVFTDGNTVYTAARYVTRGWVFGAFRAAGLPGESVQDGWVQVAMTYVGTKVMDIYINGSLAEIKTVPERTTGFPQIPWNGTDSATYFAAAPIASVQSYKGLMDEPVVYNKILSGAEIRELYLAQKAKLVAEQVPPVEVPSGSNAFCFDHELGVDYYAKGYVETFDERSLQVNHLVVTEDACASPSVLKEYSCANGAITMAQFTCPRGCLNGACKMAPASTENPQCFVELAINGVAGDKNVSFSFAGAKSLYGNYGYRVRPFDGSIADYSVRVYGMAGGSQPELFGQYSMHDPTLVIIDDLNVVERLPSGIVSVAIPYDRRITGVSVFDGERSTDLGFRVSSVQCVRTCKLENEDGNFFRQKSPGVYESDECCPGMGLVPVYSSVSDTSKFVCVKCGNGVCGRYEDKDSCPLDCR